MPTPTIVEFKVFHEPLASFGNRVVCFQVYVLIFHAPPEAFDEHVVQPAPLAVHADIDTMTFENSDECIRCELTALVSVEDIRRPILLDGFFKRLCTERVAQLTKVGKWGQRPFN